MREMELTTAEKLGLYAAVMGGKPDDDDELDSFGEWIALTRDSLESFKRNHNVSAEKLYRGFQVSKGRRRGDLFIRDFGDFRAVYFDGEGGEAS